MKKLISLALALVLILSLSTVAFAAEGEEDTSTVDYDPTPETIFEEIIKTYSNEGNVIVNETLSFTSKPNANNPTNANLTVENLKVDSLTPGKLKVTIPSLSKAGVYEWTITENKGSTAGVSYSTAEVHVIVLVEYDNVNHDLVIHKDEIHSYIKLENGEKAKTFENTFAYGEFSVAKDVTGNFANENDEFEITVTLTSTAPIGSNVILGGTTYEPKDWTQSENGYTLKCTLDYSKAGGAKTFTQIPTDVVVTVEENTAVDKMKGYTYVSTKVDDKDFTSLTVADDTNAAIVVTNHNEKSVDTGITMDSMPYILLLAVAAMGLAVLFTKKRMMREF